MPNKKSTKRTSAKTRKNNLETVDKAIKKAINSAVEKQDLLSADKAKKAEKINVFSADMVEKINVAMQNEADEKLDISCDNNKQEKQENIVNSATPEITVVAKKKVLFVASECAPYIATGGLAEVIGSLSKALATNQNYDVRVMIPLYSDIKEEYRKDFQYLGNIFIPLGWRNQYCGIFSYKKDNVTFYFLDNEFYFKRSGCYGYYDDGERFAFFCRSVLETMPFIDFYPEIMHVHDWQSALASIYLKTIYCFRPEYQFIRSLFTIHNIEYQGKYSLDILEDLFGISYTYKYLVEFEGCINLMKGAIECSERFSTVSPKYADQIKDKFYAHGLENIVAKNAFKLSGILNGIDLDYYNPETDKCLFANYTIDNLNNKKVCKAELQKMLNLPVKYDVPIIALISRLVSHKGLDLIKEVIEDVLSENVQVIILGKGDANYENYFTDLANRYQGKLVTLIAFNQDLSRKIYSGADLFLMPSKSEPCGLSQMIASRYATVPIVRETGGLYDSIKPVGVGGNGFTFAQYNSRDMLYVIREALNYYRNKDKWNEVVQRAGKTDFSWEKSAKEYENLYEDILK